MTEAVGVFADLLAAGPLYVQQVGLLRGEVADKQPWHLTLFKGADRFGVAALQHLYTQGIGKVRTDVLATRTITVRPEDRKRVMMFGPYQRLNVGLVRKRSALGPGLLSVHVHLLLSPGTQ
ncbi:hypothetical protein D3C85_1191120 [compost metagenome]